MHKHVDIVYSLVVTEECQRAVWSWSVMTVSTHGKCQQPEEPIQGWYVSIAMLAFQGENG